jgi:hypothetical protein
MSQNVYFHLTLCMWLSLLSQEFLCSGHIFCDIPKKYKGQYSIGQLLLSFPQEGRNDSIPLPDCYTFIALSKSTHIGPL